MWNGLAIVAEGLTRRFGKVTAVDGLSLEIRAGVLYFDMVVVALLGLSLWAVNGVLLRYGARSFRRGALIARL